MTAQNATTASPPTTLAVPARGRIGSIREGRPGETRALVAVQLAAQNADQEAMKEYPALLVPIVVLHARGAGPFGGDADRIKHGYVDIGGRDGP